MECYILLTYGITKPTARRNRYQLYPMQIADSERRKNILIPMKQILKEVLILFGISGLVAFTVNLFSPTGIPLFGKWDPSAGIIAAGPKGYEENLFTEIADVEAAKEIYDKGEAVFVDARASESYTSGHIKGAESLPINQFGEKIDKFRERHTTSVPVVVYCSGRTCLDSHKLAQLLSWEGFHNIRIFVDGYPEWEDMGYPSE